MRVYALYQGAICILYYVWKSTNRVMIDAFSPDRSNQPGETGRATGSALEEGVLAYASRHGCVSGMFVTPPLVLESVSQAGDSSSRA